MSERSERDPQQPGDPRPDASRPAREPAAHAAQPSATSHETGASAGHTLAPEPDPAPRGRRGGRPQGRRGADGGDAGGHGIGHSLLLFLKEVVIVVVLAVVLSLVLKTWFVQSFWIPSGSMNNTLVKDDRVSVSKLTPRFFDLQRGDIVVFEDPGGWLTDTVPPEQGPVAERINSALSWVGLLPNDEGNHLIKRVIGLPGDHVRCCTADGRLTINDTPITEPYVYPGDAPSQRTFDITVPADSVWVMGDHRSNSRDSRYNDEPSNDGSRGSVPIDKVVGRAFAVVWPLSKLAWLGTPEHVFSRVPAPTASGESPTPATPAPTGPAGSGESSAQATDPATTGTRTTGRTRATASPTTAP